MTTDHPHHTLSFVVDALREAAERLWSDIDSQPHAHGVPARAALALGIELAHQQALLAMDSEDDYRHVGILGERQSDPSELGVVDRLDLALRLLDVICDSRAWRASIAQLRVDVVNLRREADRAGF